MSTSTANHDEPDVPSAEPHGDLLASRRQSLGSANQGAVSEPVDDSPHASEEAGLDEDLIAAHTDQLSTAKRAWLVVAGVALVLLGIVGWLIPVMTGIPFWIAALVCFARVSETCRSWINAADRKLPGKVRKVLRWARDKTSRKSRTSGADTSAGEHRDSTTSA